MNKNIKHGISDKDPRYQAWLGMKKRCYNPKSNRYYRYGARGIKVCDEWVHDFKAFYDWANSHGWQEGLTIERIDVDGDYCPENCAWITKRDQMKNTSRSIRIEFDGRCMGLSEWAEETGIEYATLLRRYRSGWTPDRILTTPVQWSKNAVSLYEWNGVSKSLREWSEQYGIKYDTLRGRIRKGMSIEEAITESIDRNRYETYNGITKSISEWAEQYGLNRSTLDCRLNSGMSIEDALNRPVMKGHLPQIYELNGVSKTIPQWCEELGLKKGTVYARLEHGWSVEAALTVKVNGEKDVQTHRGPERCDICNGVQLS